MLDESSFLQKMYKLKQVNFPKMSHTSTAQHDYIYKKSSPKRKPKLAEKSPNKSIYDLLTYKQENLPTSSLSNLKTLPSIKLRSSQPGLSSARDFSSVKKLLKEARASSIEKLSLPRMINHKYIPMDKLSKSYTSRTFPKFTSTIATINIKLSKL
jgi:hypothetical protein